MKNFKILLSCVAASLFAEERVLDFVPDTAGAVIIVEDTKDLWSRWEKHPLSKSVSLSEEARKSWDSLLEDEEGSIEELKALLTSFYGDAALFLDLETLSVGGITHFKGDNKSLIAQMNQIEAAEEGSSAKKVEDSWESIEYLGEEIWTTNLDEDESEAKDGEGNEISFSVVNGYFLVSDSVELLKSLVHNIVDGGHKSLADNDRLLSIRDQICPEGSDVSMFVDLVGCVQAAFKEMETNELNVPENPYAVTLDSIKKGLALEELHSLYMGLRLTDDRLYVNSGLSYGQNRGLIKLLAYKQQSADKIIFTPKDVFSASIMNFSISEFWASLEEIVQQISPQLYGAYQMMLPMYEAQLQVNIKENLINNLGDQIATFSKMIKTEDPNIPVGNEQVFAIELINQQEVEMVVSKLIPMAGGAVQSEEYQGNALYVVPSPTGTISFTISNGIFYFSVGEVENLKRVISHSPEDRDSLWSDSEINRVSREILDDPLSLGYSNYAMLGEVLNTGLFRNPVFLHGLRSGYQKNNEEGADDLATILQGLELDMPFTAIGGVEREEGLIRSNGVIFSKE